MGGTGPISSAAFVVHGRLPGLNDYILAERTHRIKGAEMKAESEFIISAAIVQQIRGVRFTRPVIIRYRFFEPDRRRDKDNISGYAHKVIQDSLVRCGVIRNDGWNNIENYSDEFAIDKKNPRIEVTIREINSDG